MSKKKRNKLTYTRSEFQDIVCSKCGLCPENSDPFFCYNEIYKENPRKFIDSIFKNLLEIRRWLLDVGYLDKNAYSDDDLMYIFETVFCDSNFCGYKTKKNKECKYIIGCFLKFKKQTKDYVDLSTLLIHNSNKNKKKNKKTNKYIPQPYPTFFCKSSMEKEVKTIIDGNGNSNKQQDKAEECT